MVKLLEVIRKNFKILIRSKSSALIILFGPLFLILLVGTAFNTSTFYGIKLGAYSTGYNEFSDDILAKLSEDQYKIIKTDTEDECIKGVKTGAYHLCAIIPPNLKVSDDSANVIQVYVDQSRMNLVFAIKSAILNKVGQKSKEVSESLTTIVVNQLEEAKSSLSDKTTVLGKLKESNELFTSNILSLETEGAAINSSIDISAVELLQNKTNELKTQTNETRTLTEILDVAASLDAQMNSIKSATDLIMSTIPKLKENAIAESSQLLELERTSNRIISNIEAIQVKDVETLVSPIKVVTQPVTAERTHINYLFPTLIMMVIMFVSLLLSSITVIREKISPAYFRNFISPTKAGLFIVATYLTNILIIILQLSIVMVVMLFIQPELSHTLLQACAAVLLITSSFIFLGMIVGYVFNSEETSTIGAISLGTVLLFFSNTIVPLETVSGPIRQVINYNMFVVSDTILRQLLIFGSSLKDVWPLIQILLIHVAVFIIAIAGLYNFSTKRYNIKKYFHR